MKYIALHASVKRCRPEPPLTGLYYDCGQQEKCARRLATNLDARPTQDFSKKATNYGVTYQCHAFVSLESAQEFRDETAAKPMQRPDA